MCKLIEWSQEQLLCFNHYILNLSPWEASLILYLYTCATKRFKTTPKRVWLFTQKRPLNKF